MKQFGAVDPIYQTSLPTNFSESFCAISHNFMHMKCFYVDKIMMFNCFSSIVLYLLEENIKFLPAIFPNCLS